MRLLALCAALLTLPLAAPAQSAVVDEGSFTITRGGTRVGREEFRIRRIADSFVANGTVALDELRLSPAMETDAGGAPTRYQLEVRSGDDVQARLLGQIGGGRISVRTKTPRGESAKEYVVASGALVIDDDVFHQYFFLSRVPRAGTVPVVVPRRNAQLAMRVEDVGTERVSVGGAMVEARHLRLTDPSGATRQVWLDAQGRVLRVALDDRGIVAVRDEAPR